MRDRRPLGIGSVPPAAGVPLARLSGLEGMARAVMVGTVPLAALDALGSKSAVSVAFFTGSSMTLLVTVNLARVGAHVARRFILTAGIVALIAAAILFAAGPSWTIPLAIGLRGSHASIFSVCLSLYIMDFVGKGELIGVESRRMVYVATGWLVGPIVGTWAWSNVGSDVPFALSITLSIALLTYHWYLRLEANEVLLAPTQVVPGPRTTIPRFFRQRHLRVAYGITCCRATFWAALFVYGPIYVVEAGFSEWVAGAFLSVASATLFVGPIVERAGNRWGVRALILLGFALMGISLTGLALLRDARPAGVVLWLVGAVGGGIVDVLGNIPFMRLVKPRERAAMATVFATWREVSFLVAPGIAALVLLVGPFWLLFVVLAAIMALGAGAASYLPRRL